MLLKLQPAHVSPELYSNALEQRQNGSLTETARGHDTKFVLIICVMWVNPWVSTNKLDTFQHVWSSAQFITSIFMNMSLTTPKSLTTPAHSQAMT